ncbi:MAG: CRISPR-associated endoribonuclease Cas6 [Pelotomaculum sp.]|nr:CRISPR-associated endoribonuclease Cas6 [Pelotomaculum sp.]
MQLTVYFHAPSEVAVPVHYGVLLQGLIYRQMQNPALRRYLHEHGFPLEKRRFKLFTFSRLMGRSARFDRAGGSIVFAPPLQLVICSPISFILRELGNGFLQQGQVRLGDARLEVREMAAASPRVSSSPIRVRMLSPVVMYSTAGAENGRSYTYYYSPFEPRFAELIGANLAKKHLLIHGRRAEADGFDIRPAEVREKDFKITRYKDTIIKGWLGEYYLNGDPELLQVALDAGLGAKNSQGYGCCELVI